jgi:hypothetical protein
MDGFRVDRIEEVVMSIKLIHNSFMTESTEKTCQLFDS